MTIFGKATKPAHGTRALPVALLLALLLGLAPAGADPLDPFCYPNKPPAPIEGQGARSQLGLHYKLWLPAYAEKCRPALGTIAYFGTSDNLGGQAMLRREGLFFGREVPLTPAEQVLIESDLDPSGLRGRTGSVQHIPVYVDALTVSHNLDCTATPVKLRGEALALIFAGVVTRWNDAQILRDNASLATCDRPIRLAVRSEESGSSAVFKDYLAKRLPFWRAYAQPQLNQAWPATAVPSCKGYGDEGVAGCIVSRTGSIGYVSLRVARDQGLQQAPVDNAQGAFANATASGCTRAAETAPLPPATTGDWSSASLTNPPDGYALCSLGFTLAWQNYRGPYPTEANPEMVRNVRDYLTIVLSGPVQGQLSAYGVAPLPARVLALSRSGVDSIEV